MSSTVSWFVLILLLYGCPQEKLSGTNLFLCLMSSTQCNTVNNNVYLNTVINYCRQTTYNEMHKKYNKWWYVNIYTWYIPLVGILQISSLLVNYLFASCSYFKCKYGFHLYKGVKFLTDPIMYVDWKAKKCL